MGGFCESRPVKILNRVEDCEGRIFAIGDIHGCSGEPKVLLNYIVECQKLTPCDTLVFLGDYIDRGEDTKGLVQDLIDFKNQHERTIFLRGNHESMLSEVLAHRDDFLHSFITNGGITTLRSYCRDLPHLQELCDNESPEIMDVLERFLPVEHRKFFDNLLHAVEFDSFICVHAGFYPFAPLSQQDEFDIYWIRGEFIKKTHEFGKIVIFGHTVWKEVFVDLPYKIGIDTGLAYGNKLTCLELRSGLVMQVKRNSKEVEVSQLSPSERTIDE